jgi:hypothetical protein
MLSSSNYKRHPSNMPNTTKPNGGRLSFQNTTTRRPVLEVLETLEFRGLLRNQSHKFWREVCSRITHLSGKAFSE